MLFNKKKIHHYYFVVHVMLPGELVVVAFIFHATVIKGGETHNQVPVDFKK